MTNRMLCKAKTDDLKKEWVKGFYGQTEETDAHHSIDFIVDIVYDKQVFIKPDTICMCTGARDKNNIMIYENDVLHVDNGKTFVILWDHHSLCYVLNPYIDDFILPDAEIYVTSEAIKDFTVIGNIYDKR